MNGKRRLICALLLAAVCVTVCAVMLAVRASAAAPVGSGMCGKNLMWTLYDNGLLEISGTGAMEDYDYSNPAPWYEYISQMTALQLNKGITAIGSYAFDSCYRFTGSLTIPDSVKTIGDSAFLGCSGFKGGLKIGNSVTTIGDGAFLHCSGFTGSLTIPDSVTKIGESAFYNCSGFTGSLTIPAAVTEVGSGAFAGCSGITEFKVSSGNQVYSAFNGVLYSADGSILVSFPAGKKAIPAYHRSCTEIWKNAFNSYAGTGRLTIPDSVKIIGDGAFSGCSGFTGNLRIGKNVTKIGTNAFYNCSGFTDTLTLPASVTEIDDWAFADCPGISKAIFAGDAPSRLGFCAFYNNADGFTIYYQNGRSGWTTPEWNGYPCYPYEGDPIPDDYLRGDVNGDGQKDSDDAIYLLRHTLNESRYPINQSGDMNGDGQTDSDDAIYLLRHTLNESRYPLH